MWGGSSNYTFSDSNGYFFVNATNGSAEVTWAKGGYASYQLNWDINEGQSLEWNPNLMLLDGMIRGNVTDLSDDSPLEGARVMQIVSGVDWARWYSMAMTDASGAYELGTFGASGDGVLVMAEAEGYSMNYTQMDVPSGADLWMDFGLWPIDCAVTGEVTDAVTLLPIEGAGVYMQSDSFEMYTNSAPNGSYYADMVSGTYDVNVWSMDYKNYEDSVDLTSGVTNWYNISLVPYINSVIEGTVTNFYNGTPVEGATVQVWGPSYSETTTDGSGWYQLDLTDGDYSIHVYASDYEDYYSTVTAPELGTETHDVDLIPYMPPAECRLHGNVTDESGTVGVPWATVRVSIIDAEYENTTVSNETGVYEIWVPNYGDVRVTAWADGYMVVFDIIDTTGVPDYDLQLPLAEDSVSPVVDLSVDPAENISVYNPATVSGMATEADLRDLGWYLLLEYNTTGAYANYTLLEYRESTTDPYDFYAMNNLPYTTIGDDHFVDFLFDGTADNILTLDDGAVSQTMMCWEMWFGPEQFYAVQGMYSNVSGDTMGSMLFNTTTNELAYFMPSDYPTTPVSPTPLAAGTFSTTGFVMIFSEDAGWNPVGMTMPYLEPMDVDTLTATYIGLVPGGNCKAALVAADWAGHTAYEFVNFTVDNTPPVADAGADFDAVIDTDATLNGSSSSDNVGIISYDWSVEDPTGDTTSYTGATVVLPVDELGNYICELTVTDAAGYSDVDTVIVTVVPDAAPTADAGADLTTPEDVAVTFDGSASTDDVGIDNYTWYIESDDVEVYGISAEYTFTEPGTYQVLLTVNDTIGQVSDLSDAMIVTVEDTTVPEPDAGADQTVGTHDNVTFDGSGTTDNGVIDSYTWTFDDGTGPVVLTGVAPYHVFDEVGDFTVTLNVTDSYGNWATDTMVVTVEDTEAPTANAGADQTVDMGDTVTFNGSASTDNVDAVNYTWTFDDGGEVTLYGMYPTYTFEDAGTFVVTLNVTDDMGNYDTDTMTVTVNDLVDPVADAGEDAEITAGDTYVFDGSGSSDNLGIVDYTWTFMDATNQELTGVTPDYEFLNEGEFLVTLTVTDAAGNSDTDTVAIRVVEGNAAPMADAGADDSVDAGDTYEFDGLASMDDGEIENYTWTFLYDGATVTLYGAQPTFVFDIAGEYTVTLVVTDDGGATDSDTVTITVEEKAGGFVTDYWWVLVIVAIAAVAGVLAFVLMKKGGSKPSKSAGDEPAPPEDEPAPPEDEEL
jgi:PKD repeat protein